MKRFFVVALAVTLTACMGNLSLSQSGGTGGGGASGTGGASGAGGAGAPGGASVPGAAGAAGAGGTSGSQIGTAGNPIDGSGVGTQTAPITGSGVGRAPNPAIGNPTAGANAGNNAWDAGGINPNPFFADPGVQQQLQMNNTQYNQLNRAYQRALQRYNRNITGLNTAGGQTSAATGATNRANSDALRREQLRSPAYDNQAANRNRIPGTDSTASDGTITTGNNTATNPAAQNSATLGGPNPSANATGGVRSERLAEFRRQFDTEFNNSLDSTFTDPAIRDRYNQLNYQYQGFGAFDDPTVQSRLNLSNQQRQQVANLNSQWRQELMNIQNDGRGNLSQQEFNALRSRFMSQLESVLSPAQMQQWMQLVGQSYDFPYSAYVPSPVTNPSGSPRGVNGTAQRNVPGTDQGRSPTPPIEPYNPGGTPNTSDRSGGTRTTR